MKLAMNNVYSYIITFNFSIFSCCSYYYGRSLDDEDNVFFYERVNASRVSYYSLLVLGPGEELRENEVVYLQQVTKCHVEKLLGCKNQKGKGCCIIYNIPQCVFYAIVYTRCVVNHLQTHTHTPPTFRLLHGWLW